MQFIKKNLDLLLLLSISLLLFLVNYKTGTWLVGWDNVFPEFNFALNLKRDFFGIWQQYRGMGVVDGMSHISLIIHDLERLLLSFILPTSMIRWVYILGLHFIGGLGMMKLIQYIVSRNKLISFIASMFYMFNIGSIIQFYLPLEVFIVHFAFLPWIILFIFRFIKEGGKKNLFLLGILSLLATPQAHVPTVFIAYSIAVIIVLSVFIIQTRLLVFKRVIVISFILFVTNAFWFLPFVVTNISNAKTVANSKAFQMASNDIFYRNNKYGNFADVALIKGIPLEFKYFDYKTGQEHLMMWPWLNHIQSPFFFIPAWLFFFFAIVGIISAIKSKNKIHILFAILFFFFFFMLGTDIPIIRVLSQLLRNKVPLFSIVFRFTFTKFSILYAFSYTVLVAIGIHEISKVIVKKSIFSTLLTTICLLLIISYSAPAFQGFFFYENLGVKIPDEYFQVFAFFKNVKKDERIAELPIPWYWAWLQPKWGTINSGFIWHGIEQPLMNLAFMPWGAQNENFYWEFDQAISSRNIKFLQNVLKKYNIKWIYLDKNIINNTSRNSTNEDYERILSKTPDIQLIRNIGSISLYRVDSEDLKSFIGVKTNFVSIAPSYSYNDFDQAFNEFGNYIIDNNPQVYYPFRSLFSGKNPGNIEFKTNQDANNIYFISKLPQYTSCWNLVKDSTFDQEFYRYDKNNVPIKYKATISLSKNILTITLNKNLIRVYKSSLDQNFINQKNDACNINPSGSASMQKIDLGILLTSIHTNNCVKVEIPDLNLRYGYLFNIQTKNDGKRGLHIDITNQTTKKNDIEIYTDNDGKEHEYNLITTPKGFYDMGYVIYFNNISEAREVVTNIINKINIYQIPYYLLKNIKLVDPVYQNKGQNNSVVNQELEVKQLSPSNYEVSFQQKPDINSILYLSQSFDHGWRAWQNGRELKDHFLVNNWANGWKLDSRACNENESCKITIVFWPQYLEFVGFGLLIITLIFIIITPFWKKEELS